MRRPVVGFSAIAALALLLFSTAVAASNSTPSSGLDKAAISLPPAVAVCDASDVIPTFIGAKTSHFYGAPWHATLFLVDRISSCENTIAAWAVAFPKPKKVINKISTLGPPPGPPQQSCQPIEESVGGAKVLVNDPLRQYAMLQYCVAYVKSYVTMATPTPPPMVADTPPPPLALASDRTWHKVVYVMAIASDAPTSAQISYRLRDAVLEKANLRQSEDQYLENVTDAFSIIAEPGWHLADLQNQCFLDPATAGAIVALQPSQQGNTFNLVVMNQWTVLAWQTIVISCEPTNYAYTNNAAYIRWAGPVRSGRANSFSMSLAWALGAMAGVAAFNPTQTTTFATKTPKPKNLSAGESYSTGYTVGVPSNAVGAIAAAGVAGLTQLGSSSSAPNLGQGSELDGQIAAAVAAAVPHIADDIVGDCVGSVVQSPPQCNWLTKKP